MTIKQFFRMVFALIGILSIVNLVVANKLKQTLFESFDSAEYRYQSSHLAKLAASNSAALTANARQYVITLNPDYLDNYNNIVAGVQGKSASYDGRSMAYLDRLKEIAIPQKFMQYLVESNKKSVALIETEEAAFELVEPLIGKNKSTFTAAEQKRWLRAIDMLHDRNYMAEVQKIMEPVSVFIEQVNSDSLQQLEAVQDSVAVQSTLTVICGILVIFLSLISYLWIEKKVIRVTHDLLEKARSIADGDFTTEANFRGNDELAQLAAAFNHMVGNISEMLSNIRKQSSMAQQAANDLKSISDQSNDLSSKQSEAIDVIASSIYENLAAVKEVASNCTSAAESATEAGEKSTVSQVTVESNVQAVDKISHALSNVSRTISQLEIAVKDVTEILSVIEAIAEQTNLLALNAAIEAARAGEQGRGFAVVADEVRSLAQRSRNSTDEIQQKLNSLTQHTSAVALEIANCNQDSAQAVSRSKDVGDALSDIDKLVNHISALNTSIAAAAEEQEQVSEDISNRIHVIRDGAQGAIKLNQSVADASESLSEVSHQLLLEFGKFKLRNL